MLLAVASSADADINNTFAHGSGSGTAGCDSATSVPGSTIEFGVSKHAGGRPAGVS